MRVAGAWESAVGRSKVACVWRVRVVAREEEGASVRRRGRRIARGSMVAVGAGGGGGRVW